MKNRLLVIFLCLIFSQIAHAQPWQSFTPKIETVDCKIKADSSLITKCGYLIVPENRNRKSRKTIKLPYIIVSSGNSHKMADPVLFTTGGPGGSSLDPVKSIHYFSFIKERDFIAFEQRGTKYALPSLECHEVNDAIKKAYLENLPKDALINEAVSICRKRITAEGIDISAYNTEEITDDIGDLLRALKINSVNLIGISYSGGLMTNVLKKYPGNIRSLILDSPLPLFVNIDEDELANFNEALQQVFKQIEKESADKKDYKDLEKRFKQYLLSIKDNKFTTEYFDEEKQKSVRINYSRNELIDIVAKSISSNNKRVGIAALMNDLIKGNHKIYIDEYLKDVLNNKAPYSGMRLSVYCSDKMAFADIRTANQQYDVYPYMSAYQVNDVSLNMCKSWNVPPIKSENKKAFYSNAPILLSAGSFDSACRPLYNDVLHHYFPNSQRLLFTTKAHIPLLGKEGDKFISEFLNDPLKKIESENAEIISY